LAGIADAAVIDVHAHVVLAQTFGAAGIYGPAMGTDADGTPWVTVGSYRLNGVKYAGSPFMDVERRLAAMDAGGIDFQVLSPNPLTYFHFIEPEAAAGFCRVHNDALAPIVEAHSDRLAGLAALPVQDPAMACDELERAVGELGMLGAEIGTDMPFSLCDAALDPLYARCVALNVPLFIHPAPAGLDGPPGDANLKRFDLDVILGFSGQEAIAVATLIYGGVLDRHPDLDLCISHGGGATAFMLGRMARAARKRPWSPDYLRADGAFEERLARLWMDSHVDGAGSYDLLVSAVGDDRLVYGTNFAGWDAPDSAAEHRPPLKLADNARRLLRMANGKD
jgi:aminocarboxymuconate-semialdehyde decarboxylase